MEDEPRVSEAEIKECQAEVRRDNSWVFHDVVQRNVLILGNEFVGKTVLAKVLQDPTHDPHPASMVFGIKTNSPSEHQPKLITFSLEDHREAIDSGEITPSPMADQVEAVHQRVVAWEGDEAHLEAVLAGQSPQMPRALQMDVGDACCKVTREDSFVGSSDKSERYTVNLVDSPGRAASKDTESGSIEEEQEQVLQAISSCLESNMAKLHAVILVVNVAKPLDRAGVSFVLRFYEMFRVDGFKMALVFSHAERQGEPWRQKISHQLAESELGPLIASNDVKLMFSGCFVTTEKHESYESAAKVMDTVCQYRDTILEWIVDAKDPVNMPDFPLVQRRFDALRVSLRAMEEGMRAMLQWVAWDEDDLQMMQTLSTVRGCLTEINKTSGLARDTNLLEQVIQCKDAAAQLARHKAIPLRTRKDVCKFFVGEENYKYE